MFYQCFCSSFRQFQKNMCFMNLSLKNKNAIIGGSSQGLGAAIAKSFAAAGANLLLLARNEDNLNNIINDLPNDGTQLFDYAVIDFADNSSLESILEDKLNVFGKFDIVVNNTGGPLPGSAHKSKIEDFAKGLQLHLFAYQTILSKVLDGMKANGFGRIINITSIGAKQPVDNLGVSNTVRGAISSWGKTLSRELAPYGITVNNILPGYIDTERLNLLFENIATNTHTPVESVRLNKVGDIPAGRLGKAEEIANAALFLASDFADYINGINLPVDGGLLKTL